MAEPLKLDFPVLIPEAENRDQNIPSTEVPTFKEGILEKPDSYIPIKYRVDQYYKDDQLGADVLKNKYLTPSENHPWELWQRVAKATASVEKTPQSKEHCEAQFFSILEDFKFVPGGRIMHGASRNDIKSTLNNCYVVAIDKDSIRSIYKAIQDEALTYKYGGGCGHDLSILRPSGDEIGGTGGESCGPVGFMNLFSENTNTIAQHGRRGANMQTLRVDHPDIEKFIAIKSDDENMVKYSNISVLLTHEFMRAVEKNDLFNLRWGGTVYKTINAKELWDKIVLAAHNSAEPGLIFWDTMREYHNAEYCSPLVSTNPCAEQPLPNGGCCNLGAINLERFVDSEGNFMIDEFKETVGIATRFLYNIVDYNLERHALEIQKQNAINDRRIGLGILGLGDMLVKMGIKYDSEDGLQTVDQIMEMFRNTAYDTSVKLGIEKGSFPNYKWEGYGKSKFIKNLPKSIRDDIEKHGIRNSTITTVAPTGSGAIVARVTSGIEPIFETSYKRRVKRNDGYGKRFDEYTVIHPIIKKLFGDDKNLPDYIVTAHNIDPFFRVKMQGIIQKYIDSSISSTVNLAEDTPVETVADIYMKAYKAGLKGITVYREGSREGILITNKKPAKQEEKPIIEITDDVEIKTVPINRDLHSVATEPEIKFHEPVAKLKKIPKVNPGPRLRPIMTQGVTQRIRTGEGTLYITINEDEDGLCEVFTAIGKAGGHAAAQSEAISRLISLALRSGINPKAIVKQLKGISGPSPNWESGRLILSTPDAIGKALDDYLKERGDALPSNGEGHSMQFTMATETEEKNPKVKDFTFKNIKTCPDCGGPIRHEGGCVNCPGCGFSKCE
ncbi:adenosylcobalamin-dependent ribonucleoside-diphosphate reductase [bacterium]|nr:adenosylcobalamin-dependent ribonucleoside-diphosphate reductase [bacterium]